MTVSGGGVKVSPSVVITVARTWPRPALARSAWVRVMSILSALAAVMAETGMEQVVAPPTQPSPMLALSEPIVVVMRIEPMAPSADAAPFSFSALRRNLVALPTGTLAG